jgi:hypothetical protein
MSPIVVFCSEDWRLCTWDVSHEAGGTSATGDAPLSLAWPCDQTRGVDILTSRFQGVHNRSNTMNGLYSDS